MPDTDELRDAVGTVTGSFPVRFLKAYGQSKAGNYASGLAFNAFMSMFPLMLGILAIIGLAVRDRHLLTIIEHTLAGVFPGDAQNTLIRTLQGVRRHSGILGILSIAGLLWSGTGLFAFMEFALGEMFGAAQRNFIRQRLMGLVMIVIFIVGMLIVVFANIAAAVLPRLPYSGPILGAIVMTVLMTIIYRVVPNRTFSLREVWMGALLAGVGIEVLTLAFPIYARLMHGFNTYGATFALFFLLATWLYFLSQLILLGAVLNRMLLGPPQVGGVLSGEPPHAMETEGSRAIDEQRKDGSPGG